MNKNIEKYSLISGDECEWLSYCSRKTFGIPLDLYFDETGWAAERGLPPCVYVRNGYYRDVDEWFLVTIEDDVIPYMPKKLKVSKADLSMTLIFITRNAHKIKKMGVGGDYSFSDFIDDIGTNLLTEKKEAINEMAKLKPKETGLPKEIWIDEGGTFKKGGHWLRLKVQTGNSTKSNEWATLTLPDYVWRGGESLSEKEKQLIVKYARVNVSLLTQVLLSQMTFPTYKAKSYKLDAKGEAVQPEETQWFKYCDMKYHMTKYKSSDNTYTVKDYFGKFVYIGDDGEPIEFNWIEDYKDKFALCKIGDKYYKAYIDGTLIETKL